MCYVLRSVWHEGLMARGASPAKMIPPAGRRATAIVDVILTQRTLRQFSATSAIKHLVRLKHLIKPKNLETAWAGPKLRHQFGGRATWYYRAPSFILIVCLNTVDPIRSTDFSCPNVHSNPTGASDPRSTDFARA